MVGLKRYHLGFSLRGFAAVALVMLPHIIWMLFPPAADPLTANVAPNAFIDILINLSQYFLMSLLIFCIPKDKTKRTAHLIAASVILGAYYVIWAVYYAGIVYPFFLVSLAVLPSAYLVLVSLWLNNRIAVYPAVFYSIFYIAITCFNYL